MRLKIVHIVTLGDSLAGVQKHILDVCTALHNQSHDVTVLIGTPGKGEERQPGLLKNLLEAQGVEVKRLHFLQRKINLSTDRKGYIEIKDWLSKLKPDIVAAHSSKAGFLSRLACYNLKIPNTFTIHGWSFADGIPFVRRNIFLVLEKLIGKFTDTILTVSIADRDLGVRHNITAPEKIIAVHNGVLDTSVDTGNKNPRPESAPVKIVMVARFQSQKDHHNLVEALSSLKDLNWELDLLGPGPLLEKTREQVKRHGMSEKVIFHGEVNNVPEFLSQSDIFALISKWEGFPLSILEAMAHSLPIIASDVGGVSESVKNEYNGYLVPRGDVQKVRSALKALIQDKDLRKKYGANSRILFKEQFEFEKMVESLLNNYNKVIENRKEAPALEVKTLDKQAG